MSRAANPLSTHKARGRRSPRAAAHAATYSAIRWRSGLTPNWTGSAIDTEITNGQLHFERDGESGVALVEYALLLALVFLAALTAVSAVGVSLSGLYDAIQTEIAGALGG